MADGKTRSVSVVFQALTDKFTRKTKGAGNTIGSFAKKAAIGAAAAGAAFLVARVGVAQFRKEFEKLDTLGKLSDSLQVSPDFLRGLDLAATQTGSSFATAQKALSRFVRSIGEAKSGTGEGIQALEILGVKLEDIESLNTEDQFLKIAESIKSIEDPSLKAAAAAKLFGRSGQDLINLFDQGEEGIKSFIAQQKELGGGISRDDIRQVEAANDAVDKMGRAWEGIIQQLSIALAPVITKIADGFTEILKFTRSIGALWTDMELGIKAMGEGWIGTLGTVLKMLSPIGAMTTAIKMMIKHSKILRDVWNGIQGQLERGFTNMFFGGKGADITLGVEEGPIKKKKKDLIPEVKINPVSIKNFSDAIAAGSSAAFNALNPNSTNSVANQTLEESKMQTGLLSKIAGKGRTTFKQVTS
jgi:hypothetical protein